MEKSDYTKSIAKVKKFIENAEQMGDTVSLENLKRLLKFFESHNVTEESKMACSTKKGSAGKGKGKGK